MSISFFPAVCLRTPGKPFYRVELTSQSVVELIDDEEFMNAIYAASPMFYRECLRLKTEELNNKKHKRTILTLWKYYNRMSTRSTPFGLFSFCGAVRWGKSNEIIIDYIKPALRLDMGFILNYVDFLENQPPLRTQLNYKLNSSFYRVGDEYRYYEYDLHNGKRDYKLVALESTVALQHIIEKCKRKYIPFKVLVDEISAVLEVEAAEVVGYLNELIDSQILVSSLQPKLNDDNLLITLIKELNSIADKSLWPDFAFNMELLGKISGELLSYDNKGSLEKKLNRVTELVALTTVPFDTEKLFQIDSYLYPKENTVDGSIQEDLKKAIRLFQIFNSGKKNQKWIANTTEKIIQKYDRRLVALTTLFDPDTGINDEDCNTKTDFDSELGELNAFQSSGSFGEPSIKQTPVTEFLGRKLTYAIKNNDYSITFSEKELNELEAVVDVEPLPDTFPIIFKIVKENSAGLLIESAGGTNGNSLLGRFAHVNNDISEMLADVASFEKQKNANSILAGVVHLPENRIGNVLQVPGIRDYEITYLGQSVIDDEHQIPVEDLYVKVDAGKIRLFSKTLQKEIIPRIDNAHNYTFNTLPCYRFFGELQNSNNLTDLRIDLSGSYGKIQFFPRMRYQNIILQAAQWLLDFDDYKNFIFEIDKDKQEKAFNAFCDHWQIPQYFIWTEGDKGIVINRNDSLSIDTFITGIKEKKGIILKEFIAPHPDYSPKDRDGFIYNHQLVAIAKSEFEKKTVSKIAPEIENVSIQRKFIPGSEWLYYKIYCSVHFSDKFLIENILQLQSDWIERTLIHRMFFIRYKDPGDHLRLRFHLTQMIHLPVIIQEFGAMIERINHAELISDIKIDTYERELERYGNEAIPFIEECFSIDSELCLNILKNKVAYQNANISLPVIATVNMFYLLNHFLISEDQKKVLITTLANSLKERLKCSGQEMEIVHKYVHNKIRQLKSTIQNPQLLNINGDWERFAKKHNSQLACIFDKIKNQYPEILENQELAASLMHMHYNRLFSKYQLKFEMIGYKLLLKCYS